MRGESPDATVAWANLDLSPTTLSRPEGGRSHAEEHPDIAVPSTGSIHPLMSDLHMPTKSLVLINPSGLHPTNTAILVRKGRSCQTIIASPSVRRNNVSASTMHLCWSTSLSTATASPGGRLAEEEGCRRKAATNRQLCRAMRAQRLQKSTQIVLAMSGLQLLELCHVLVRRVSNGLLDKTSRSSKVACLAWLFSRPSNSLRCFA